MHAHQYDCMILQRFLRSSAIYPLSRTPAFTGTQRSQCVCLHSMTRLPVKSARPHSVACTINPSRPYLSNQAELAAPPRAEPPARSATRRGASTRATDQVYGADTVRRQRGSSEQRPPQGDRTRIRRRRREPPPRGRAVRGRGWRRGGGRSGRGR